MKYYIDKAAVVAKIDSIENETNYEPFTGEVLGKRKVCKDLKDYLDTIEVKEVDLSKEHINKDDFIGKAWNWIEDNILSSNQQDKSRLYYEQFINYIKGE